MLFLLFKYEKMLWKKRKKRRRRRTKKKKEEEEEESSIKYIDTKKNYTLIITIIKKEVRVNNE